MNLRNAMTFLHHSKVGGGRGGLGGGVEGVWRLVGVQHLHENGT